MKGDNAQVVQDIFNFMMSPFLYQGNMSKDRNKANKLYEEYFDGNIQKMERETISTSIQATWDNDGIEAGLLNVNEEKVHLEKQEVSVTEYGDIAEIEIHEVYENKTFDRQEIFYYFSLPPNAVITGLWLSDSDSIAKKYSFNVSPRGAAQKVYKAEVRRRVDPSLLEQVGDNQYRLRAFPIEPKRKDYGERYNRNKFKVVAGPHCHLWFSYKTLIHKDGWKLPILNEKRNVYWSENTTFLVNGKLITKGYDWLPHSLSPSNNVSIQPRTISLSDSTLLEMIPKKIKSKKVLNTSKVDLIIDGSYSMHKSKEELINTLHQLKKEGLANGSSIYFINRNSKSLTLDELLHKLDEENSLFFGATNNLKMAHTYNRNTSKSDITIMITDQGNYESIDDSLPAVSFDHPLYLLHLNNMSSSIYSDAFLETVYNSGGGFATSVSDLMNKIALANQKDILAYDEGVIYKLSTNENISSSSDKASAIAAKYFINRLKTVEESDRLELLDKAHQLALQEKIVTAFSSMIVLVNDRQLEALKKAEQEADRFDREVETGAEQTSKPFNPLKVTGTPEPHEWILIIMVSGLLLYHFYQKRVKTI